MVVGVSGHKRRRRGTSQDRGGVVPDGGVVLLPAAAWWDEYYQPMQSRITGLEERLPDDPVAAKIVGGAKAEIDYFRRFSNCYSYEFFIVQPAG